MKITLINMHVLNALKIIPSNSIDCIITSPPYLGLRSYKGAETIWGGDINCKHDFITESYHKDGEGNINTGALSNSNKQFKELNIKRSTCVICGAWLGQLGHEPTYQEYIEHLMLITKDLKRVLKPTGTLFWNIADSYVGGHKGGSIYNKNSKISKTDDIPQIKQGRPQSKVNGISEKSLIMIPERFAISMIEDGWILRNKIIWEKINPLPVPFKDRLKNRWEYVFFFTKSKKYYFNLDRVRTPYKNSSIKRSKYKLRSLYINNQNYIKPATNLINTVKGVNPGDVIATSIGERNKTAHCAVYPQKLIEPLLKMGCPEQGVVLDPFAGSGTTGIVAKKYNMSSILIEISTEYCKDIKKRIHWGNALDIDWEEINNK